MSLEGVQSQSEWDGALIRRLGCRYPIVSAPMAMAAGAELALAVAKAGGVGLIGGGYGDEHWLLPQLDPATQQGRLASSVGVGFITWSLKPDVLALALKFKPAVLMLSFGDPRTFADQIHAADVPLMCQCQTLEHVEWALQAGASFIVAQGSEAGGHGARRSTLTLVPEVADRLKRWNEALLARGVYEPVVLLAAGGIADGRGLAAALMLGADGVLMGTRFWASQEALVPKNHHQALLQAQGDSTIRTNVPDVLRKLPWPPGYSARVARNAVIERWHERTHELQGTELERHHQAYLAALQRGDPNECAVWFGEAAGLIDSIAPAQDLMHQIVEQAKEVLTRQQK